jgi:hypothetical protein
MASAKEEGICWECRGVDLESFMNPSGVATKASHPESILIYDTSWINISKTCILCSELKSLFQLPSSAMNDVISHQEGDLRLRCHLRPINHDGNSPRYLKLFLYSRSHSIAQEYYLIPRVFTRHVNVDLQDLAIVKRWIGDCQTEHPVCGYQRSVRGFRLKVINCVSRQLCSIVAGTPYVCLSYVWGHTSVADEFFSDNVQRNLPKTVADSMWVALQLGISYLWVDRYCIDQANSEEKHYLIQNMDTIYSSAALTIVSTSGNGPHAGLPGVEGTNRRENHTFRVGNSGLTLTVLNNPRSEVLDSVWHTRAWTFQELYLSRRCLIFTDSQIYFQCKTTHYVEGLGPGIEFNQINGLRAEFQVFQWLDLHGNTHDLYDRLIEYYDRKLSYREDIVKAFLGVLNAFEMNRGSNQVLATQLHGLPVFYSNKPTVVSPSTTFAISLSWRVAYDDKMRDAPAVKSHLFPSWSWASIKADRHPASAGILQFQLGYAKHILHQEDLQFWVTHNSGKLMAMDYYIGHADDHSYEDVDPCIHIKGWAIPSCLDAVDTVNEDTSITRTYNLSGFENGFVYLDYPKRQHSTDLVAIHIGTRIVGTHGLAIMLIMEKTSNSTYQRVGMYSSTYLSTEDDGVQTFLNTVAPDGDWQLRTVLLT